MQETIKTAASYCEQVNQYLKGESRKPPALLQEFLNALTALCTSSKLDKAAVLHTEELLKLKKEAKATKKALEEEIRLLEGSASNPDKLIDLYMISKDMYELHEILFADEREKVGEARALAQKAIPKQLKEKDRQFRELEKRLVFRNKLVQIMRGAVIVSACAALTFLFADPRRGTPLIFVAVSVLIVLPLLTIWLRIIADDLEEARLKRDPHTIGQALSFLKNPKASDHLWILLSEPFVEAEYRKAFVEMLVDLGTSCEWIDTKSDRVEALKSNIQDVVEEAYTLYPKTFDPAFLKRWRNTFEELQQEVREHFGKTASQFYKKTAKDHTYFLGCFQKFLLSDTGKKLKAFLREI